MIKTFCDWCGKEEGERLEIEHPSGSKHALGFNLGVIYRHICADCLIKEVVEIDKKRKSNP